MLFGYCMALTIPMVLLFVDVCVFFFKQKTAYEMRISDWSSDVCSSDLNPLRAMVMKTLPFSLREHPGRAVRSNRIRLAKTSPAGPLHGPRRFMRRQAGRHPVQSRIYIGQDRKSTRLNSSH